MLKIVLKRIKLELKHCKNICISVKSNYDANHEELFVSGQRVAKIFHTMATGKFFLLNFDSSFSLS